MVNALELSVEISISVDKLNVLSEFDDFTAKVMCLDFEHHSYIQNARVYRVGVTNAADRGLDMYSNWGPAIQIKHLTLDIELAKDIVSIVKQWQDAVVGLDRMVYADAKKEFSLSAMTGFGADGSREEQEQDFEQVRGVFESNPFVTAVLQHIETKTALGNELIERLSSLV